jgi:dienelactone hydrolase
VSRVDGVADAMGRLDLRGAEAPSPRVGAPFRVLWDTKEDASVEPTKELGTMVLRALVDGKTVATGSLQFDYGTLQEPKVIREDLKEPGLFGTFFLPQGKGPFPGVIVWGGSEGGIRSARFRAAALAKHGFATLALAYFDKDDPPAYPDLPKQLIEIRLEYFEKAIAWMKKQKQVRGDRLAVMGGSRGGELALLVGSMFPDVKAVVAYTPSHVAWGGWPISEEDRKLLKNRPAWTYQGKPVPFVSRVLSPDQEKKLQEKDPFDRRPLFAEYLKDKPAVAAAVIPVEKIAGPILIITGKDDRLWPASQMADEVMKRLDAKRHRHRNEHLAYEACGHSISLPLGQPGNLPAFGGTAEANSYAAWDSWPKVVRFLEQNLK